MLILKLFTVLATTVIWSVILYFAVIRMNAIQRGTNILRYTIEYIALIALASLVVNICLWITDWSFLVVILIILPLGLLIMFSLIAYKKERQAL